MYATISQGCSFTTTITTTTTTTPTALTAARHLMFLHDSTGHPRNPALVDAFAPKNPYLVVFFQ